MNGSAPDSGIYGSAAASSLRAIGIAPRGIRVSILVPNPSATVTISNRRPYSAVGNIGDTGRLEEGPPQPRNALDGGQLRRDLVLQVFALAQRCSGNAGAL